MAKLIGHAAVAAACALTQFAFGELAKMEVSPGASTIDVHVVDDRDGKPMANLTVEAEFAGILSMGHIYDEKYRQCTDADGRCLFKGQNNNPYAYIAVPPPGICRAATLNVPGQKIPTENPQTAQPASPRIGTGAKAAVR